MYASGLPLEHPFAALKAAPEKALYPQAVLNPVRAGWRFWMLFPLLFLRSVRSQLRLRKLGRRLADELRRHVFPYGFP